MDNLTHTLVGFAAAEVLCQWRREPPSPAFRTAAWTVSAVANNVPDLDILYSAITPGPLGYLLHHRGHSHTILIALVEAALLFAAASLVFRRRRLAFTGGESGALVLLAVLGPLLHVAFDGFNSYGVHPFWPFDNRWLYGDSLFIVEPTLWITLAVPLAVGSSRGGQMLLGAVALAAVLLSWFVPTIPATSVVVLSGLAAGLFVLSLRLSARARATLGALSTALVIVIFAVAGARVRGRLWRETTDGSVRDIILTPVPANPLCWVALVVTVDAQSYFVRKGLASAWPSVMPADRCRTFRSGPGSVPLQPIASPYVGTHWFGQYRGNRAQLKTARDSQCEVAAFLQFARVPYLATNDIGDLRFDWRRGSNFARIALSPKAPCPPFLPPWKRPADWID